MWWRPWRRGPGYPVREAQARPAIAGHAQPGGRGADDPGSWRAARGSRAAPLAAVVLLAAGLVAASSLLASAAAAQPLAGADSRHVAIGQSR